LFLTNFKLKLFCRSCSDTHRLQHWEQLQLCDDNKEHIRQVCQELEVAATHFFASFGWPNNARIKIQVRLISSVINGLFPLVQRDDSRLSSFI
jgi:hypothetical protein